MWLFNNPRRDLLKKNTPSTHQGVAGARPEVLVRFNSGGSGSFVSADAWS